MDRRDTERIFRGRLNKALDQSGLGRAALARAAGIDRSTLSQLLSPDNDRLPRADTVAAIAGALQVSLDWLLGLSQDQTTGADILQRSLQIEPSSPNPVDERLDRWHAAAAGYKIRYVPASLPDALKTDEMVVYEYGVSATLSPSQASAESQARLAYVRLPETDMEVCCPIQTIESFARGEGKWRRLGLDVRLRQLHHMIALLDELYPSYRVFLFDALTHFSAPFTVFGPRRAAVYIGQMYLVFNTTEHIRVLSRHFDNLIRAAVTQPPEVPALLARLAAEIEDDGPRRPTRETRVATQ